MKTQAQVEAMVNLLNQLQSLGFSDAKIDVFLTVLNWVLS